MVTKLIESAPPPKLTVAPFALAIEVSVNAPVNPLASSRSREVVLVAEVIVISPAPDKFKVSRVEADNRLIEISVPESAVLRVNVS